MATSIVVNIFEPYTLNVSELNANVHCLQRTEDGYNFKPLWNHKHAELHRITQVTQLKHSLNLTIQPSHKRTSAKIGQRANLHG